MGKGINIAQFAGGTAFGIHHIPNAWNIEADNG